MTTHFSVDECVAQKWKSIWQKLKNLKQSNLLLELPTRQNCLRNFTIETKKGIMKKAENANRSKKSLIKELFLPQSNVYKFHQLTMNPAAVTLL